MTKVVVVGAGIGGLATSIALRETDVEVVVLERAPELAKVELGAGVTLWPNAMLILDRLGVGDEIRERGAILKCFEQRNARGRLLSRWPMDEMARRARRSASAESTGPIFTPRSCAARGGAVRTGCNVERFEQRDGDRQVDALRGRPSGESGDVLIGADGMDSMIRKQLLGDAGAAPLRVDHVARATCPTTRRSLRRVDFIAWWGAGAKFVIFRSGPERLSWEEHRHGPPGGQDAPGERKRRCSSGSPASPIRSTRSSRRPANRRSSAPTCSIVRRTSAGAAGA